MAIILLKCHFALFLFFTSYVLQALWLAGKPHCKPRMTKASSCRLSHNMYVPVLLIVAITSFWAIFHNTMTSSLQNPHNHAQMQLTLTLTYLFPHLQGLLLATLLQKGRRKCHRCPLVCAFCVHVLVFCDHAFQYIFV